MAFCFRRGLRRRLGLGLGLGLVLVLSSCLRIVLPEFPHQVKLQLEGRASTIRLDFYSLDRSYVPVVMRALSEALEHTTRLWGPLEHPVTLRIFPTHRALEEAVNRRYRWLRAWAMFDQLYLQAPRTWRRRQRRQLGKLLAHELTHVLMYQRCCERKDWARRRIPLWFREGMASVTAAQGSWRYSRQQLRELLQSDFGKRLWRRPSRYMGRFKRQVYSLAHWMFVDLVKVCSDNLNRRYERLETLLAGMKRGLTFSQSMRQACGLSEAQFRARFAKIMGFSDSL